MPRTGADDIKSGALICGERWGIESSLWWVHSKKHYSSKYLRKPGSDLRKLEVFKFKTGGTMVMRLEHGWILTALVQSSAQIINIETRGPQPVSSWGESDGEGCPRLTFPCTHAGPCVTGWSAGCARCCNVTEMKAPWNTERFKRVTCRNHLRCLADVSFTAPALFFQII